jgi:hypothetical protein
MMNGRPRTIVGVMAEDFFWPVITARPSAAKARTLGLRAAQRRARGPMPTLEDKARDRQAGYVRLVAALTDGSVATAQAELESVAESLARDTRRAMPDTR